jgi:predicted MFS family arabinose efflux permease
VRSRESAIWLLSLAVGTVLADSAIVTLALPSILRQFDVEVSTVAWVLISFNLVLAIVAVPAARICIRYGSRTWGMVGLVVFAAACAGCALAPSFNALLAARVTQALGGAFVIAACLEMLVFTTGSDKRGATRWALAGVTGAAIGPVVGGLLTAAISWQSIFIVQIPLVLLAFPAMYGLRELKVKPEIKHDRPNIPANLALALLSAALTAALFLLVLLIVEGWRKSPALAALTVTMIPVAAFGARPIARWARAGSRAESIAGIIMVAGGLLALAHLPHANPLWTLPAQVLIGLGLGMTIDSLTQIALRERLPHTLHGGWTIAARHAGIVVGLAILTPIFTHDLHAAEQPAKEAITAQVLDSQLPIKSKISLAVGLGDALKGERGKIPDLHPAFADANLPAEQLPLAKRLEHALDGQLEAAATHAFRTSFLVASLLALLALIPAFMMRDAEAKPS